MCEHLDFCHLQFAVTFKSVTGILFTCLHRWRNVLNIWGRLCVMIHNRNVAEETCEDGVKETISITVDRY